MPGIPESTVIPCVTVVTGFVMGEGPHDRFDQYNRQSQPGNRG